VAVITVLLVGSLSAITVALVRGLQNKPRSGSALPPQLADQSAQLAQLQQSVDAIAIEVERMAEGQRFRDRLLSERSERAEA
jgi:hypothetical protein